MKGCDQKCEGSLHPTRTNGGPPTQLRDRRGRSWSAHRKHLRVAGGECDKPTRRDGGSARNAPCECDMPTWRASARACDGDATDCNAYNPLALAPSRVLAWILAPLRKRICACKSFGCMDLQNPSRILSKSPTKIGILTHGSGGSRAQRRTRCGSG